MKAWRWGKFLARQPAPYPQKESPEQANAFAAVLDHAAQQLEQI